MDPVASASLTVQARPEAPQADPAAEAAEEFEAVFIATFLSEMLEQARPKTLGGGSGEQMFGSLMAQEIAREIARGGGLGLARSVASQIDAYKR